jgi:hypothetical protein
LRASQKDAELSKQQLFDLVRLCKQQERAHAALEETLKVLSMTSYRHLILTSINVF